MVAHVRQRAVHAVVGEGFGDDVGVLHRQQWQRHARRRAQLARPAPARVHHHARAHALPALGAYADDPRGRAAVGGSKALSEEGSRAYAFDDVRTQSSRAARVRRRQPRRVECAVRRRVQRPIDVIDV